MNQDQQILSYWSPTLPQLEGEGATSVMPIGFIATSFTFNAEFFEEECLTRFLCMETEKENDGAAFLVEREEKLAGLKCGIVLIDQQHCKGSRSLRWDLVSCRVPKGIQHAKITLLYWTNAIRIIIGSANLTKPGCCINQEIFGVMDYSPEIQSDRKFLVDVLDFLKKMVKDFSGATIQGRFAELDKSIRQVIKDWGIEDIKYKRDEVSCYPLFVAPGKPSALSQMDDSWTSPSPADTAIIVSPFFDQQQSEENPSQLIYDIMRRRGGVEVDYHVVAQPVNDAKEEWVINAPEYLDKAIKPDTQDINFFGIEETGTNEDDRIVPRPLHAKSLWLGNDNFEMLMIGSSNFTSAGMGTGKRINYESNIVYSMYHERIRGGRKKMDGAMVLGELLKEETYSFTYKPVGEDVEEEGTVNFLPICFGEALLIKVGDDFELQLQINHKKLPKGTALYFVHNNVEQLLLSNEQVLDQLKDDVLKLRWTENHLPDHILVSWEELETKVIWPVVIDQQISLPPVEQLRDLPLEALLQILGSSQPLHRLLKMIEKAKMQVTIEGKEIQLDALKRVDSSSFLLQRTRRIAYSLRALRERLEKPVFTKEMLEWRLYGPIGVACLIDAIKREAGSKAEQQFFLAELSLELTRLNPRTTDYSLSADTIKNAIKKLVKDLVQANKEELQNNDPITRYTAKALKKALEYGDVSITE